MDNRRTFLAAMLSISVLIIWNYLFPPPPPAKKPTTTDPGASVSSVPVPGGPTAPATTTPQLLGTSVVVETPDYRATFDTKGARLVSFELLDYTDSQDEGAGPIDLITDRERSDGSLILDLTSGRDWNSSETLLFEPSADALRIGEGETGELAFHTDWPGWGRIEKRYSFDASTYEMTLTARVEEAERRIDWVLLSLSQRAPTEKGTTRWDIVKSKVAHGLAGTKVEAVALDAILKEVRKGKHERKVYDETTGMAPVRWAGWDQHYFLSAVITDLSKSPTAVVRGLPDGQSARVYVQQSGSEQGEATEASYRLYFGPKDLEIFKTTEETLSLSLEFGWFGALARFFVGILKYFHSILGNWGVAIICLTILVRGALFPLSFASFKSMKKMQALQPDVAELREKFPDDPEKLNRELMNLYKREKVNPLGGCLPLLLQFPVFLGLYYGLAGAIELRHADFALWITDLSAPDPYYIAPIVMGATMWIQQKMTPAMGDPTQQKVMQMMPVIFLFFFLNFPSGLVIYWLFSNLFSIAQQYYIRRTA